MSHPRVRTPTSPCSSARTDSGCAIPKMDLPLVTALKDALGIEAIHLLVEQTYEDVA